MKTAAIKAEAGTVQTPTAAGLKLISAFLQRERQNNLDLLTNGQAGMPLPAGDGGALASAKKMAREGFVTLVGARHRRFIIVTQSGRAAGGAA